MSIVLSALLGTGIAAELVLSALHATWELEPLVPAVLSGSIWQIVTFRKTSGERPPISRRALGLMTATVALAVISSVAAWTDGRTGGRTEAVVATSTSLFFLVSMVTLAVARRNADRTHRVR